VLEAISSRIIVLWGWRRLALAFLAGGASALAMPPVDAFPVLFVTFPTLVWLIDGTVGRGRLRPALAAAAIGWCFGFGYFLAGLWWVGFAFLVDAEEFGWMMPFAVAALPAGLALFTAAAIALARLLWSSGPQRIFAFALALTLADIARGQLFTGFPWNSFGYSLTATPILMQAASLVGVYGLSAVAAVVFASPAALSGAGSRRARFALPALALALLAGQVGFGLYRLGGADVGMVGDIRLRIVQPSIRQSEKWQPENRNRFFADYLALSDSAASPEAMGIDDVDVLIWPESALPFVFEAEPAALPAIAALLPPGTVLLAGMERVERDSAEPGGYRVYNSVMVIDEAGKILDIYDKAWLVPFGEFLPFQRFLESLGLRQLTRVIGGFTAGPGPKILSAPGVPPFLPLICYEIIFPGRIDSGDRRPDWILNVTNDGWFGDSPGPWQHLRQARLRAVEEGLPVVRAANTGVSAVIDPYGRLVKRLGIGVRGVIDSGLPQAAAPTLFGMYANWILAAVIFVLIIASQSRKSG
jgi:apolipoprotein N-acyltransferase